jgi:hypothetical protein
MANLATNRGGVAGQTAVMSRLVPTSTFRELLDDIDMLHAAMPSRPALGRGA